MTTVQLRQTVQTTASERGLKWDFCPGEWFIQVFKQLSNQKEKFQK